MKRRAVFSNLGNFFVMEAVSAAGVSSALPQETAISIEKIEFPQAIEDINNGLVVKFLLTNNGKTPVKFYSEACFQGWSNWGIEFIYTTKARLSISRNLRREWGRPVPRVKSIESQDSVSIELNLTEKWWTYPVDFSPKFIEAMIIRFDPPPSVRTDDTDDIWSGHVESKVKPIPDSMKEHLAKEFQRNE